MNVNMTRKEVLELYAVLSELSRIRETRFAYFVAKNKKVIQGEIDVINEIRKPPEKYIEYERKRIDLVTFHAERDEKGEPIIQNGNFKVVDEELFASAFKSLSTKYSDTLIEAQKQEDSLKEFLTEFVEFFVYPISFKYLPNTLNSSEVEKLMPFIDGDVDLLET